MSSTLRKIKRNKPIIDIKLSMKYVCPNCNNYKIISREEINTIKPEEFRNNKIFICKKCNVHMLPTEVIADF